MRCYSHFLIFGHIGACLAWVVLVEVMQSLECRPCPCTTLGKAIPQADRLILGCDSLATFRRMHDRLTIGSGVMSNLTRGTFLRHSPGEIAARRAVLEVVVEITDGISFIVLNDLGKVT